MTSANNTVAAPIHSIAYRPEIDGLRALAVTLVILVHAFPQYMQNGFIGVDIFFVISGFLINGILITQLDNGSFSLQDFYIRRANRIFPALVLVLAVCMGFGWLSLYATEFKLLGRSIVSGAGFVANVASFLESGYWDVSAKLKPLLHLWSLGVEEQFYLFWPVLLWAAWARHVNVAILCCVLIALSFAWNLWSIGVNPPAAFYLPFSRFWELLAGSILAYAAFAQRPYLRRMAMSSIWTNLSAFLGLTLIIVSLVARYPTDEFPGWHALLPVLGTVLIISSGSRAWFNAKVLSHPWIVYVGLISFPLYLWHWPLLTFARILENGDLSDPSRVGALLLTVLLAVPTYHFVERPIRTAPRGRGLKAVALGLLLAICGAAGYSIYTHDGLEARYAIPNSPARNAVGALPPVTGTYKIALLGDSHAGHFGHGLVRIYKDRIVGFVTASWPYLAGMGFKPGTIADPSIPTPQKTDADLARIVADPAMDTVIIAHQFVMYIDQDNFRSYPFSPSGETSATAYENGLRRTVKLLTDAGKQVIYVKSVPLLYGAASAEACSAPILPIPRKPPPGCANPLVEVQNHRKIYDQLVSRALDGFQKVSVLDPLNYLCDRRYCYAQKDGNLLYLNDGNHLNDSGSELVAGKIAEFIEMQHTNVQGSTQPY
jgi:peptidoglycan/LPS O-acetylase OafA/YrhL